MFAAWEYKIYNEIAWAELWGVLCAWLAEAVSVGMSCRVWGTYPDESWDFSFPSGLICFSYIYCNSVEQGRRQVVYWAELPQVLEYILCTVKVTCTFRCAETAFISISPSTKYRILFRRWSPSDSVLLWLFHTYHGVVSHNHIKLIR